MNPVPEFKSAAALVYVWSISVAAQAVILLGLKITCRELFE